MKNSLPLNGIRHFLPDGGQIELLATMHLTFVASMRILSFVRQEDHIDGGLRRDLLDYGKRLSSIRDELADLRSAYKRYGELLEDAEELEYRIRLAAAVLGENEFDPMGEDFAALDTGITFDFDAWRDATPLWKAIQLVLRQVPEIRAVELEAYLQERGFNASRQAVDSALRSHRKEFRIKKRGREKYLALKT